MVVLRVELILLFLSCGQSNLKFWRVLETMVATSELKETSLVHR